MVNISLRDKETHFDQRPSHRPVSRAVRDALAHAQDCVRDYNDRLNEIINNGIPGIDWTEVTLLANRANEAEAALELARDIALNPEKYQECTCLPDLPDGRCFPLCPVCKADIDRQDGIPFEGSGL